MFIFIAALTEPKNVVSSFHENDQCITGLTHGLTRISIIEGLHVM